MVAPGLKVVSATGGGGMMDGWMDGWGACVGQYTRGLLLVISEVKVIYMFDGV